MAAITLDECKNERSLANSRTLMLIEISQLRQFWQIVGMSCQPTERLLCGRARTSLRSYVSHMALTVTLDPPEEAGRD